MALHLKWTSRAKVDYTLILEYLDKNWPPRELIKFINKTNKVLLQITKNPNAFPLSKAKDVHKCVLAKQISIYYRVKKDKIELLTFWDNRRQPKKLKL